MSRTSPEHEVASASNPILVEVRRGGEVESFHRGAAAIADFRGELLAAWGDIERPVFPRSAVKMIQALPLIESGAADRFGLTTAEIALACASHSGEPGHVLTVERWLTRIGLSIDALECGAHYPLDQNAAQDLRAKGATPTPVHNNCSGKHAGFLTTGCHANVSISGYTERSHPVQRMVTAALCEMTELDLEKAPCGTDGCGIPAYALPLRNLAAAMAKLARPAQLKGARSAAVRRMIAAAIAHPWLLAGTGRFDTRAMSVSHSAFIVKMGAEGVHVAIMPSAGLGIALKIDDGARRGAELAMAGLLRLVGGLDEANARGLMQAPILSHHGDRIGQVMVAERWIAAGKGQIVSFCRV